MEIENGIKYDFFTDTFTIYGIRYSGQLFRDLSIGGLPDGTKFRIDKRENGTVYLSKLEV